MISFVIPTRDRFEALNETLAKLGALPLSREAAELIIVDNDSAVRVMAPERLENGIPVRIIRLGKNFGAAARTHAAHQADGDWLVMLDDDSSPTNAAFFEILEMAPADVAAIGAEITLPDGSHEAGGLPEVIVGCGCAIRREAYLQAGGYDPKFHYYVEEYDLCARLLLAGRRIVHDRRFKVEHRKVTDGRDMNTVLRRLIRNNLWVHQRYAPASRRRGLQRTDVARYFEIAKHEHALPGYVGGLVEGAVRAPFNRRQPMDDSLHDRFTGLWHARTWLGRSDPIHHGARVAIVNPGKSLWCIARALVEQGARLCEIEDAEALVVGTLSPGPILDAIAEHDNDGRPIIAPWQWNEHPKVVVRKRATIAA